MKAPTMPIASQTQLREISKAFVMLSVKEDVEFGYKNGEFGGFHEDDQSEKSESDSDDG